MKKGEISLLYHFDKYNLKFNKALKKFVTDLIGFINNVIEKEEWKECYAYFTFFIFEMYIIKFDKTLKNFFTVIIGCIIHLIEKVERVESVINFPIFHFIYIYYKI